MEEETLIDRRKPRSAFEIVTFKMDRTLAIIGIILIGGIAIGVNSTEAIQLAMAAVGGLVGYIGGRAGK
jgi:hypothetical protein